MRPGPISPSGPPWRGFYEGDASQVVRCWTEGDRFKAEAWSGLHGDGSTAEEAMEMAFGAAPINAAVAERMGWNLEEERIRWAKKFPMSPMAKPILDRHKEGGSERRQRIDRLAAKIQAGGST